MAQPEVTVVRFAEPADFLTAVKPYDDSFRNWVIGTFMESMGEAQIALRKIEPSHRVLLGAYLGDELVAVLIRIKYDYSWKFSNIRDESALDSALIASALDSALIASIASTFAQYISTNIEPKAFDRVFGPDALCDALITAYATCVQSKGLRVKLPPVKYWTKISYAIKATLPPPSPAFSKYPVQLATPDDVEALGELNFAFFSFIGSKTLSTIESCTEAMRTTVALGETWVCRVDGEIAGFCTLGRSTPRTFSIKNVYVSPNHRRKGVAETIIRALTRYYLGAEPLGFEGAPPGPPPQGFKQEICLNVKDGSAIRLYHRAGFLLGEEDRDPISGKRGWIDSSLYDVYLE